jgi:serine/threonine protein kinase
MHEEDVAEIVTAVASALDYAHKKGLLHRDVKPANNMLNDDDGGRRILLTACGIHDKMVYPGRWDERSRRPARYSVAVRAQGLFKFEHPRLDLDRGQCDDRLLVQGVNSTDGASIWWRDSRHPQTQGVPR